MKQAYCRNDDCEHYDSDYEDNCSASELICNNCPNADWSDQNDENAD